MENIQDEKGNKKKKVKDKEGKKKNIERKKGGECRKWSIQGAYKNERGELRRGRNEIVKEERRKIGRGRKMKYKGDQIERIGERRVRKGDETDERKKGRKVDDGGGR